MEHSVKHLRAVLSVARTILMNLADAEEVAQEAVLKALSNIQGFRGQTRFSTWLIQITVNEARNRLRQNGQPLDGRQTDDADEYVPKDFIDWREILSAALLRARLQLRDALAPGLNGRWCHNKTEYQRVRV
jgi:RNA polymerase sigma-70 factor, ECF subfamily